MCHRSAFFLNDHRSERLCCILVQVAPATRFVSLDTLETGERIKYKDKLPGLLTTGLSFVALPCSRMLRQPGLKNVMHVIGRDWASTLIFQMACFSHPAAHPAVLPNGDIVNFTSNFGSCYTVYRSRPGSNLREKIAEVAMLLHFHLEVWPANHQDD